MSRSSIAALLLAISSPVLAQDLDTNAPSITRADVSRLKPGQFIWKPSLAPAGSMTITVNLRAQRASVYRDHVRIGAATISAGKPRHRTPTGVFRILEKDRIHRSKKYDNAPMPFTLRFTRAGVALHGGIVPGYPTSHGCVHLPRAFARALFDEAPIGTTVVVTNERPWPRTVIHQAMSVSSETATE